MSEPALWMIVIGALTCGACSLVGCFLVLKNLSMMGDAISHSVLPGIVIAVLFSGSLSSWPIFIGAGVLGILAPLLIDLLKQSDRVYEDASLGAVFTVLFAIGVVMITRLGDRVHVDTDCVLYGEIAIAPFDTWTYAGMDMGPMPVWSMGAVFVIVCAFVFLFYKELKISTFDEQQAHALGMHPTLVHYLLMGAVALTTVAAFKSVGAILVVGMLIAPASAAYLVCDRLGTMLFVAVGFGMLASPLGYFMSTWIGVLVGGTGSVSVSGSMTLAAGLIFLAAFLFSPKDGLVPTWYRRWKLSQRIDRDNFLVYLYRAEVEREGPVPLDELDIYHGDWSASRKKRMAHQLAGKELVELDDAGRVSLTDPGQANALNLLRSHRLWETLMHDLGLPEDHVHRTADEMEHYLDDELQEEIREQLDHPEKDPHGRDIPNGGSGGSSTDPEHND